MKGGVSAKQASGKARVSRWCSLSLLHRVLLFLLVIDSLSPTIAARYVTKELYTSATWRGLTNFSESSYDSQTLKRRSYKALLV